MTVVSACGGAAVVDATSVHEQKQKHWRWHTKPVCQDYKHWSVELQPFPAGQTVQHC